MCILSQGWGSAVRPSINKKFNLTKVKIDYSLRPGETVSMTVSNLPSTGWIILCTGIKIQAFKVKVSSLSHFPLLQNIDFTSKQTHLNYLRKKFVTIYTKRQSVTDHRITLYRAFEEIF